MTEFYFHSINKKNTKEIQKNIKNVLFAFFIKNGDKYDYFSGMVFIISFFLCFMSEENAFFIFSELVENILPKYYFRKINQAETNDFYQEKQNIFYLSKQILPKIQFSLIEEIINDNLNNFFENFLINSLNFQCIYFIFESIFSKNSVKQ